MMRVGMDQIFVIFVLFEQTSSDTLPTLSLSSFDASFSSYHASSSSEYAHPPSSSSSSSFSYNETPNRRYNTHSSFPILSKPASSLLQLAVKIQPRYQINPQVQPPPSQHYFHDQRNAASEDEYGDDEDDYYPNYYDEEGRVKNESMLLANMKPRGPYFASNNSSMKVFLGSTATLECTVLDLTNESVSWIRVVDDKLELLTWASHKYTTDKRYTLVQKIGDSWQRWQLQIRDANVDDEGQYRCQISTQPPMLMSLTLDITEPLARVVDERGRDVADKHYNSGSMIELKCIIEKVPFPHKSVTWRRGNTPLTFNTSRGGISVKGSKDSDYIRSRLYVANASPADSGIYSCWYGNYTSDNVTVHVIAGENSQAMQRDPPPETPTTSGCFSNHVISSSWICLVLSIFLAYNYAVSGYGHSFVKIADFLWAVVSSIARGFSMLSLPKLKPKSYKDCSGMQFQPLSSMPWLNKSEMCRKR
ncbi:uncharacterized protein [Palaemon carinicauda]|uniref:uncharacterized protein n=1 Tax=Palaemon carinicauda TaxID=392227 RepID=UPI0035B68B49